MKKITLLFVLLLSCFSDLFAEHLTGYCGVNFGVSKATVEKDLKSLNWSLTEKKDDRLCFEKESEYFEAMVKIHDIEIQFNNDEVYSITLNFIISEENEMKRFLSGITYLCEQYEIELRTMNTEPNDLPTILFITKYGIGGFFTSFIKDENSTYLSVVFMDMSRTPSKK